MNLLEILGQLPASECTYEEWVQVGMALKHEGYTVSDWNTWSMADSRYKAGNCAKKWESFKGNAEPVTAGTIVQIAKDHGWTPPHSGNSYSDDYTQIDYEGIISYEGEAEPVKKRPVSRDPVSEIIKYLRARFEPDDYIGYVTSVYETDGKLAPTRGSWGRTAGQIIDLLEKCKGDIGSVLGDADPRAGAWIRVNPLDGKGIKDENVTDYRYVLVESDSLTIEQQNVLMRELALPIVTLTHTGGKSLHAICHIDAGNNRELYRQRVAYMFDVCEKNGLKIDKNCKNPSRLTRLPGFQRGENWQYLVDTNIGKASFEEWKDYIEEITDDLPDEISYDEMKDHLPPLRPALIDGVLRCGHKMLLAGPSKAGKSFSLISLAIAIAEGGEWLGFRCRQGKVLYINLELDEASCWNRIAEVYKANGVEAKNAKNLTVWNLRGRSMPMDKLAPSMIRRAKKAGYTAIILDPIYKVITGDENSAEQMSHFCNVFDRICRDANCAMIYCHHHSKGMQGGKKSMDRASGSGVFARDPDALLDMIELPVSEQLRKTREDKAVCAVCKEWLQRFLGDRYGDTVSLDDEQSRSRMMEHCRNYLKSNSMTLMQKEIQRASAMVSSQTAWRIEGTLREFPRFQSVNVWFEWPRHIIDQTGALKDVNPDATWQQNFPKRKTNEERKQERKDGIMTAFSSAADQNGEADIKDIMTYLGVSENTVRSRLKEHGGFWFGDGKCGLKASSKIGDLSSDV